MSDIVQTYVPARARRWFDDKTVRLAMAGFWGNVLAMAYDVVARLPQDATVAMAFQAVTLKELLNVLAWAGACVASIWWGGDSVTPPGGKQ